MPQGDKLTGIYLIIYDIIKGIEQKDDSRCRVINSVTFKRVLVKLVMSILLFIRNELVV